MNAPGVVGNRYAQDTRPTDTGTNVLYTANGAPPATGEVAVDGVSNTVNVGRGLYLSPWVPFDGSCRRDQDSHGHVTSGVRTGRGSVHKRRHQVRCE